MANDYILACTISVINRKNNRDCMVFRKTSGQLTFGGILPDLYDGILPDLRGSLQKQTQCFLVFQRVWIQGGLPWKMGAQHGGPSCRNRSASMASQRGGVQWRSPRSQRHLQVIVDPRAYIRCILAGNNNVRFNPT